MQHGLEADSAQWVVNSADKAPAFILARAGYDVWMGNNRGTQFSRGHEHLDSADPKDMPAYYDFDFEDMGLYDITAFTDFITEKTGQEKITYIGHSMGTSQFFVGATMLPEYYEKKFNLFVALSPIVREEHTKSETF